MTAEIAEAPASGLERMLRTIHWTLEHRVAPSVEGDLAQSYLRTLLLIIDQACKRTRYEWRALHEDLDDLVETLNALGIAHPLEGGEAAAMDLAALESRIASLEPMLVDAMPSLSADQLARYDSFVQRRFERRLRWLPATAEHAF